MKKFLPSSLLFLLVLILVGCSSTDFQATSRASILAEQGNNGNTAISLPGQESKILVVYFSQSGNTEAIAKHIQERVGGDLLKLETIAAYPSDYNTLTRQAKEELEAGFQPELRPLELDIASYEIIFLGSPNWWSSLATPVISFLHHQDLAGKTVIPFMTHGGSVFGRSTEQIKELCPEADLREGFAVRGNNVNSAQTELDAWLIQLNLL